MTTDGDQNRGYDDQELLLKALESYLVARINRSERIIRGLIRQCVNEWSDSNGLTLRKIKGLDETARQKAVEEMTDLFLEKMKHLVDNRIQRETIKSNIMQIYLGWVHSRRTAPSDSVAGD